MIARIVSALMIIVVVTPFSAWSATPYGRHFLWGAAYSAHQTEGKDGGGENGDWYAFEHPGTGRSPIEKSDNADVAVDHWNRYEEDLQAAKKLGLNTLRTSIAWEKVEPRRGVFKKDVVAHYRAEFLRMRQLGLRPMVCLHHFTHPLWFQREGGWTNARSAEHFLAYAKFVIKNLRDVVDIWITFNEPMMLVQMGYLKAEVPPEKSGVRAAFAAAFNTARAHRLVAHYIHQTQRASKKSDQQNVAGVGVAYAFGFFDPLDPTSAEDRQATEVLGTISNWAWLEAVQTGHLEFRLRVPGRPDQVMARDMPHSVPNAERFFDWLGVNYYQRYFIKYNYASAIPFTWVTPPGPRSDNDWSIYPEGLERILRAVAQRFHYPLIVTENGLADEKDDRRPQFIRDHLRFLDRAVGGSEAGPPLDIRGYYHWSLMDNFEWLAGYHYHFGLYAVERQNGLRRRARPSAQVYADEIARRRSEAR